MIVKQTEVRTMTKHEREMKYIKHTIINMCDTAMGMVICGKSEQAFEVLKAANTILEFEKWNRAGDFSELQEIIEKTAKEISLKIVFNY